MAKGGKRLLGLLAIGAAAAGTYYYLQKKNSSIPTNMEDDEDLDNFEEDMEAKEEKGKRSYVSLDFDKVEQKVQGAAEKIGEVAGKAASSIGNMFAQAEGKVEDFFDEEDEN